MNLHLKQSLMGMLIGGIAGLAMSTNLMAQSDNTAQDDPALKIYRASATKVNDIVHTKLDVRFDYAKRYLYGLSLIHI